MVNSDPNDEIAGVLLLIFLVVVFVLVGPYDVYNSSLFVVLLVLFIFISLS